RRGGHASYPRGVARDSGARIPGDAIFGAGFPFWTNRRNAGVVDLLRPRYGYVHPLGRVVDGHHDGNAPQPAHVVLPQLKGLPTLLLGVRLGQVEELPGTRRFPISFPPVRHFLLREPDDRHSSPFSPISTREVAKAIAPGPVSLAPPPGQYS